MKIIHFSDWHATLKFRLPPADLYICTGDMLPNYPLIRYRSKSGSTALWDPQGCDPKPYCVLFNGRVLLPEREASYQKQWIAQQDFRRDVLGNTDAPVICVRGNHDFTDLAPLFGGDVWEVSVDSSRAWEGLGLRVGGMRGINWIDGEWSDELRETELEIRARTIPRDLDVIVSHCPPLGVLDSFRGEYLGCHELWRYASRACYDGGHLKLHCFGHIHEANGYVCEGETGFSNAALNWREIVL